MLFVSYSLQINIYIYIYIYIYIHTYIYIYINFSKYKWKKQDLLLLWLRACYFFTFDYLLYMWLTISYNWKCFSCCNTHDSDFQIKAVHYRLREALEFLEFYIEWKHKRHTLIRVQQNLKRKIYTVKI